VNQLVDEILRSIDIDPQDGSISALPAGAYKDFEQKLKSLVAEKNLFVDLAFASVTLSDAGMVRAAAQLLALARIGLRDEQVDDMVRAQQTEIGQQKAKHGMGWRRNFNKSD